jgi:hypothetical protein
MKVILTELGDVDIPQNIEFLFEVV